MNAQKQVKKDLHDLQQDLGALVKHLSGKQGMLQAVSDDVEQAVAEKLPQLLQNANETLAQYRDALKDSKEKVEEKIQERPITSVLIALGVGAALGKLWGLGKR